MCPLANSSGSRTSTTTTSDGRSRTSSKVISVPAPSWSASPTPYQLGRAYGGAGRVLGQHFARADIACLTWDRPGIGHSTGDYNAQTFQDRAEEVLAAVRFLRERSD